MSSQKNAPSKSPIPDKAEHNAFFPSPFSLSQFTASKTDFSAIDHPHIYRGKKKILMIATQERYLKMKDGKYFSTGNHPVEMLLPMHHLNLAGFEFDIATPSGDLVKLERWAFPQEDKAIAETFEKYRSKLENPLDLRDVAQNSLQENSPYIAIFIPGGHGVLNDIPTNKDVSKILHWAQKEQHFIISLCHGPAALLAASSTQSENEFPFKGYEICVFPDSYDAETLPEIGYLPSPTPWLAAEKLEALGLKILNKDITGKVHRDRNLLTGDSPLASNALGQLAAKTLLAEIDA
ncbi:protein deglycase HchA [Acetobacteraceae bacterium]|nr:protein deglycase HchA [Acetobacteraceae bacterium]